MGEFIRAVVPAAGVAYMVWASWRHNQDADESFHEGVLADAATLLSRGPEGDARGDSRPLLAALRALLDSGQCSPLLERLERVEVEVTSEDADEQCDRTVTVAQRRDDRSASVQRLTRRVPWLSLPAELRLQFIQRNEDRVVLLLLRRTAATQDAGQEGGA